MSTRTLDRTSVLSATRTHWTATANRGCTNSLKQVGSVTTSGLSGTIKTTTSCKSRRRKVAGFYPVRPFSVTETKYTPSIIQIPHDTDNTTYGCRIGEYRGETVLAGRTFALTKSKHDLENAIQGCINTACAQAQSDAFNAFTTLAEGAKSLKTISDVTSTLFAKSNVLLQNTAKANRRYYRSKATANEAYFSLMQDFNNIWLMSRYGIRPLVYDVKNFVDTYRYPPKVRKRGTAMRSFDINEEMIINDLNSPIQRLTDKVVASGTITVRGRAWAEIPGNRDSKLIHKGNIAETAWDLVPISFLVDKIVDVKSFLINTTVHGVDLRAVSASIKTDVTFDRSYSSEFFGGVGNNRESGTASGDSSVQVVSYERWPSAPSRLPPLDQRLNTLDWVDFASIAASKYRLFEKLGRQVIRRL